MSEGNDKVFSFSIAAEGDSVVQTGSVPDLNNEYFSHYTEAIAYMIKEVKEFVNDEKKEIVPKKKTAFLKEEKRMTLEEALKCADKLEVLQDREVLNKDFLLPHPYTIYQALILLAKEYRAINSKREK